MKIDGEMQGDTALDFSLLTKQMPQSGLSASANLLVFPNIEAANISYNLLKTAAGNGIAVGPILLGCASPVQILTPHATVRRIVNMTAMCVVEVELRRTTSG
ncbi:phosphate acyltransferase [Methylocucumis oryzae]|uniref:phosphate acyltransferase n=1 Tax=Methylocucumis oryzae TaxID=1632867 RepID=UPI000A7EA5D2|nr:phosphate acyltransferase [Methylocucumis oryzae]